MVTTPDENGIIRYTVEDGPPIPSVLNLGLQSVSDAVGTVVQSVQTIGQSTIHRVANVAERNALVASFQPSALKPLTVYRNNSKGNPIETTVDGVNWTGSPRFYTQGGAGADQGYPMPSNMRMVQTMFTYTDFLSPAGVLWVPYPIPFWSAPIVIAQTIKGAIINPVCDSGIITPEGIRLVWPGVTGGPHVQTHLMATGWLPQE